MTVPSPKGFRRPWHRRVWRVLESLNSGLLSSAKCYFGGGTRIAMALGEFRESVDVDFLCSDRDGYRTLRNTVTDLSLGAMLSGGLVLLRDVRADMYGIRTFLRVDGEPVKFEIIAEGRIAVAGDAAGPFPVEALDRTSCVAEKLLAHADRGGEYRPTGATSSISPSWRRAGRLNTCATARRSPNRRTAPS